MEPTTETQARLRRVQSELRREFPHLAEDRIDGVVQSVAARLLERARFDTFVPVLVHRGARERLT